MEKTLHVNICKPKILTDWIEYFVQFQGNGMFSSEIYAQPYAYILFNHNHLLEISYQNKNIQTQKSLIEPITLSPFTLKAKIDKQTIIFGAKVKSTFLYMLTGVPLNLLTDNILNLDELFKQNVTDLIEKINSAITISDKAEIAENYLLTKIKSFKLGKRKVFLLSM